MLTDKQSDYIFFSISIHGVFIKVYRNFDGVSPVPGGPKLSTYDLFTLQYTASPNLIQPNHPGSQSHKHHHSYQPQCL
jgi:hypothetical protein